MKAKRLIAVLLTLCLIVSAMPVGLMFSASAESGEINVYALPDGIENEEMAQAAADAIDAIGTVTYKSRAAIEAAEAAFDALTENDKSALSSYKTTLDAARLAFDEIISSFSWTPSSSRPGSINAGKVTKNKWMADCSAEIWSETLADVADTVKYAYYNGRDIGKNSNPGKIDDWQTAVNGGFWHFSMQGPDNYNKQGFRTNFTTVVPAFPGMAFAVDTTFAQNYGFEQAYALGEYFKWNGKTYQVMWGQVRSYNSVEPSPSGTVPGVTTSNNHPEERASNSDTNKNIFRYAYSKYSHDNRWNDLTLGVPTTAWASKSGDNTFYQVFEGPQGNSYLITTADMIAAAPSDPSQDSYNSEMDKSYAAVTGELAAVIAGISDFFEQAGDFVIASEDAVTFTGGVLTADGFDVDADAPSKRVQSIIDALPDASDIDISYENQIKTARSEYEALEEAQKSKVDTAKLIAAEKALELIISGIDDAAGLNAAIAAVDAIGKVTYKSKKAIVAAETAYAALSDNDKAHMAEKYDVLTSARTAFDALVDAYSVTFTDSSLKSDPIPWTANFSAEDVAKSQAAMADEAKYQYQNGVNIGIQPGATKPRDMWNVGTQLESLPNDNVGNPWGSSNRYLTLMVVPFSGMAFTFDAYLMKSYDYDNPFPIGNMFTYDGKNYQVLNTYYRYYDSKPYVNGGSASTSKVALYPGSGTYEGVIGNVFVYAYANYSQANKWDDKTLGIPADNAGMVGSASYYQNFIGPDGDAYIFAAAKDLEGMTLSASAAGYEAQLAEVASKAAVITGELASALKAETGLFEKTGSFLYATDTEIVFENGVFTASGFKSDTSNAEAAGAVDKLIDELGEISSLDQKAAVTAARKAYDELTDAQKLLVTKLDVLEIAEKAISVYQDQADADNVAGMITALGEITSTEQKAAVEAARAAYNALSIAAKGMMDNDVMEILFAAEDAVTAKAVDEMIEALGEITSLEQKADIEAARAAYEALTAEQKALVALLDTLKKAEEAVDNLLSDAGVKGDVDNSGEINVSDMITLKNLIMSGVWTDQQLYRGDMNNDGNLTVADMLAIKNLIMS